MVPRALISVSVCLASALHAAGATAQPDKISGLLNNSPFGQSRGGAATAAGTNDPLEFRAVLEDKGGTLFSIYDTAARRSVWVQLKDSSNGFAVNEYDAAKENVTVDFHGRAMVLPIKRAPAVAVTQQVRPAGTGPVGNLMPNGQPGPAGASPVDQQRIQQIQEEIRRRRALREQPSGNTNPAAAQSGPQQMPFNGAGAQYGPMPVPATTATSGQAGTSAGPQPMPSNSPGPQAVPTNSAGPQPIPAKP